MEVLRSDLVLNIFEDIISKYFLIDWMWGVEKKKVKDEFKILVLND